MTRTSRWLSRISTALICSLAAASTPACGDGDGGGATVGAGGTDTQHEQVNARAARVFTGYRDAVSGLNEAWDRLYLRGDVQGWDKAMASEVPSSLDALGAELDALLTLEKELDGAGAGSSQQGLKTQDFGVVSGALTILTITSLVAWYNSTKSKVQQQAADKAAALKSCYARMYKTCMQDLNNQTVCDNIATKRCAAMQFHNGVGAVTEGATIVVSEGAKKALEEGVKTALPVLKIPGLSPSKVKAVLDYGDGLQNAAETGQMLGQTQECKSATSGQQPQRVVLTEGGNAQVDFADGCSLYLGSAQSGTFGDIPKGSWDLTLYTPGDSRSSVGGVELQGGEERPVTFKKRKLKAALSKDCIDAYEHYCGKLPGMNCAGQLMTSATDRIKQSCGEPSGQKLVDGGMSACSAKQACPPAASLATGGGQATGCTSGAPQTFGYSGQLDVDGRKAQMELTFEGRKVTGKLTGGPVCEPNFQLPKTQIAFTGMLRGSWTGAGSVSGSWTGPDLACNGSPMAGYPTQGAVSIWQESGAVYLSRNVGGGRWTFAGGGGSYTPKCP